METIAAPSSGTPHETGLSERRTNGGETLTLTRKRDVLSAALGQIRAIQQILRDPTGAPATRQRLVDILRSIEAAGAPEVAGVTGVEWWEKVEESLAKSTPQIVACLALPKLFEQVVGKDLLASEIPTGLPPECETLLRLAWHCFSDGAQLRAWVAASPQIQAILTQKLSEPNAVLCRLWTYIKEAEPLLSHFLKCSSNQPLSAGVIGQPLSAGVIGNSQGWCWHAAAVQYGLDSIREIWRTCEPVGALCGLVDGTAPAFSLGGMSGHEHLFPRVPSNKLLWSSLTREALLFASIITPEPGQPPAIKSTAPATVNVNGNRTGTKAKSKRVNVNGNPSPKRYVQKGHARVALIAQLALHHKYGCDDPELHFDPITVRGLADKAQVSTSTASSFFNVAFNGGDGGGHKVYRDLCERADSKRLLTVLKRLYEDHTEWNAMDPKHLDRRHRAKWDGK